ncbi:uncharacterized protein DUF805 [Litoreibacter meonggei]|uniref:Uncharacterized protein DUF805 n=1 Tax=Litoreibacter meonggei TaxID=1049199 RepID=A0A497X1H8_9RHOB|nr:DUF805 domain-containing protein [Litoreibacter meonggei]RLJ59495.1 uncharacterized protein DUF805 [Litoreibacter meonggei]
MGPVEAIATCLRKFITFSGRASNHEFWWFYIPASLLIWLVLVIEPIPGLLLKALLLVPLHAVAARRMRDQDKRIWPVMVLSPIVAIFSGLTVISLEVMEFPKDVVSFLAVALLWATSTITAFWLLSGPSSSNFANLSDPTRR